MKITHYGLVKKFTSHFLATCCDCQYLRQNNEFEWTWSCLCLKFYPSNSFDTEQIMKRLPVFPPRFIPGISTIQVGKGSACLMRSFTVTKLSLQYFGIFHLIKPAHLETTQITIRLTFNAKDKKYQSRYCIEYKKLLLLTNLIFNVHHATCVMNKTNT